MESLMDQNWLAYARRVFMCARNGHVCDAPTIDGIDPTLRWPGFFGRDYHEAPKRLLLVGRVHNPSGWRSWNGIGDLEAVVSSWLAGHLADDAFLAQYRQMYADRLLTWGPWRKVYAFFAAAAETDVHGVAYTNLAKCWQHLGGESATQRRCTSEFPLEELVEILKPDAVFVLATDGFMARVPGARVASVPMKNDSAPHFQIPWDRLQDAENWVRDLPRR